MNLRWLSSYIAVVEEGGVTPAARKMFISPQALLQQVNLLEKEAGFQLFHRTSTGMMPTEAGEAFYRECLQLLDTWSNALETCRTIAAHRTVLRIPVMNTVLNPDSTELVCTRYRQLDPNGPEIRYINTLKPNDTWIDDLLENRFDVIKWYKAIDQDPQGTYFEKLEDVQTICICRDDHPLASYDEINLADLDGRHVGTNSAKLSEAMCGQAAELGLSVAFESIPCDRYSIASACERGCLCFVDKRIAASFATLGYQAIPLVAPSTIEVGFACREQDADTYATFFEAVRQERAQGLA